MWQTSETEELHLYAEGLIADNLFFPLLERGE